MSQMFNLKTKIFVFVSLLIVFNQAAVAASALLYDVEVLVVDESADTRWRVFKEGLDEVFIRISGDSIVMDKLKRPPASRYIKQYSYDPVEQPALNKNGKALAHRLKIQYNGSAMASYLHDNGYPVWGEHRTDTVIWLAIRDGKNEYVLKDADQSLLKTSAEDALHRRGIPERWPLFDSKDRKILKVADIRGGFKDPVVKASKRYSSGPALTGSLIWNGAKWQSSWSLLMENGNRHWNIEDADYNRLINKAIDQTADAMGFVFAIHGVNKNQQLSKVQLEVQAVNSIKKYRKLENYLRELSAVEMVTPSKVDGQNAIFEITLRSDESAFLNLINNDAELIKAEPIKPPVETPIDSSIETPLDTPVVPVDNQAVEQELQATPTNAGDVAIDATTGSSATNNALGEQPEQQSEQPLDPLSEQQLVKQTPQIPVYHYKLIK